MNPQLELSVWIELRRPIISGTGGTSEHTFRKHRLIGTIDSKWLHVVADARQDVQPVYNPISYPSCRVSKPELHSELWTPLATPE